MSNHINPFSLILKKYLLLKRVFFFGYVSKRPFRGILFIIALAFIWGFIGVSYTFMTSKYSSLSSMDHEKFKFYGLTYRHARHNGGWYINFKGDNGKERSYHTYLTDRQAKKINITSGEKITLYFKNEYITPIPPIKIKLRKSIIAITHNGKFIFNNHDSKKEVKRTKARYSKIFYISVPAFIILFLHMYKVGKSNLKERGLYD